MITQDLIEINRYLGWIYLQLDKWYLRCLIVVVFNIVCRLLGLRLTRIEYRLLLRCLPFLCTNIQMNSQNVLITCFQVNRSFVFLLWTVYIHFSIITHTHRIICLWSNRGSNRILMPNLMATRWHSNHYIKLFM